MDALAKKTEDTSKQGVTRLQNALTDLAGEFLKSTGATNTAITAINNVAGSIKRVTEQIPDAVKALEGYFDKLSKAPYFQSLVRSIAASEGGDTPAEAAAPFNKPARPSSASDAIDRAKRERGPRDAEAEVRVNPISANDFKPKGKEAKGGSGGGSGGRSENDYQTEIKSIRERTAALQQEATTVGQSEGEVAKAETAFKLLAAAKKSNIAITPTLMADIEATASAMGLATQKLHEAEEANRKFAAASKQAGDTLGDAFKDAVLEGEKLTVVLNKLLKSLASRGIDSVFDSLFSRTGAGTSALSSLFGSAGIPGRAQGGIMRGPGTGTSDSILARLSDGEYVVNAQSTKRFGPLLEAINKGGLPGYAAGGLVGVPTAEFGREGGFGEAYT